MISVQINPNLSFQLSIDKFKYWPVTLDLNATLAESGLMVEWKKQKKETQMIICPQCRNKIPEDWTTCKFCNAKLSLFLERDKSKKRIRRIMKIVLTAITAVALIIGVIVVYAWSSGFEPWKPGAESIEVESQEYINGMVKVCLGNLFSTAAVIDAEYANGKLIAAGIDQELFAHSVTCFYLQYSNYNAGDECMLVTMEGTLIKFKIQG